MVIGNENNFRVCVQKSHLQNLRCGLGLKEMRNQIIRYYKKNNFKNLIYKFQVLHQILLICLNYKKYYFRQLVYKLN